MYAAGKDTDTVPVPGAFLPWVCKPFDATSCGLCILKAKNLGKRSELNLTMILRGAKTKQVSSVDGDGNLPRGDVRADKSG